MEKTIGMRNIMEGLGIKVDDIVLVNKQVLICNDKYDLVKPDETYCQLIPNLILGMVSGKYKYKIYSLKNEDVKDDNIRKILEIVILKHRQLCNECKIKKCDYCWVKELREKILNHLKNIPPVE